MPIKYTELPERLGKAPLLPVYYQRVEGKYITIEAYLPDSCTAEQQTYCHEKLLSQKDIDAVEIILVSDMPQEKLWYAEIMDQGQAPQSRAPALSATGKWLQLQQCFWDICTAIPIRALVSPSGIQAACLLHTTTEEWRTIVATFRRS